MQKKTLRASAGKQSSRRSGLPRRRPRAIRATSGIERRPTFEVWATIRRGANFTSGTYGVCLWGTQDEAFAGSEPDEHVCLVRVEVLEVLDE